MKRSIVYVVAGLAALLVIFAVAIGGTYNSMVAGRENVRTSLAKVQSQYQRRADLVPNLVATVKGAANFEQSTLTKVVEARAKATSMNIDPSKATPEQLQQYQAAQGELSQALGRLLAISENYPELKATEAFRDLQVQLEGTENRISVARDDFNTSAKSFNTQVQRFPANVVAGMFGFQTFPYFEADNGAATAPKVDFGN